MLTAVKERTRSLTLDIYIYIYMYMFCSNFPTLSVIVRPHLAPKPIQTGPARKMMQKSPKNNPGDNSGVIS